MASTLPVTLDQTATMWRDDTWLPGGQLHKLHALAYFARSVFFDPDSSNARAARLNVTLEQLQPRAPGVEYVLADQQEPHLYVIRKLFRSADNTTTDLAYYYILDGSVYQAPSIHAALSARMQRCLHSVRGTFEDLRQDLDPLSRGVEQPEESALERELAAGLEAPKRETAADRERGRKVEANLRHVLQAFTMPVPTATLQLEEPGGMEAQAAPQAEQPAFQHRATPGVMSGVSSLQQ